MDQIFTAQFWHDQWAVIASAPWLVIPSLLIAGLIGWKWKGSNDDGEIRGLRAEINAGTQRLGLAREKYEAVVNQLAQLKDRVAQQDKVIVEIKREPTKTIRVDKIIDGNTEIREAVIQLSTYTGTLGQALRMDDPRSTGGSG